MRLSELLPDKETMQQTADAMSKEAGVPPAPTRATRVRNTSSGACTAAATACRRMLCKPISGSTWLRLALRLGYGI